METAASKAYREMYQKVMEDKEELLFDTTRGREMQSEHYNGARKSFFAPDFAYFYMSAFQVKTGKEITHILTKVKKIIIAWLSITFL